MRSSINNVFKNLITFLILICFLGGSVALLIIEQTFSYDKINNLKNQKTILFTLTKLEKDNIELALIQFNGKSTQLLYEIEKLRNLYKYDYTGDFILNNSNEYLSDLDKLEILTNAFNESAQEYYVENNIDENEKQEKLKNTFYNVNSLINTILSKNTAYEEHKFQLLRNLSILLFLIIVFTTFWYRRRLNAIYNEILYLYGIENNNHKGNVRLFFEETNAISLKMKRKPIIENNPEMTDSITLINNYKGMLNSYFNKKGIKSDNFTSISIFEVDNFSKIEKIYNRDFIKRLLKKIAFILSLHEQITDVIARTGTNQFTVILSRISKEQSLKDIDIIHQSISEMKFKTPEEKILNLSTSVGFVIKPNNKHLEDVIKEAKRILKYSKDKGGDRISQIKDLAEDEF